jgi:hypothetical protein
MSGFYNVAILFKEDYFVFEGYSLFIDNDLNNVDVRGNRKKRNLFIGFLGLLLGLRLCFKLGLKRETHALSSNSLFFVCLLLIHFNNKLVKFTLYRIRQYTVAMVSLFAINTVTK